MKQIIKIVTLVLIAFPAYATNVISKYSCVHDQAIGFILDDKKWTPSILDIKSSKLIIQQNTKTEWDMYIGGGDKSAPCSGTFDESGYFECQIYGIAFYFNRNSLRFQIYLRDGYVMGDGSFASKNSTLHPSIAIGTCSSAT